MLIDITIDEKTKYFIDFSESTIFFLPPHELNEKLLLRAWGI
ncbi:hypothetical protein [Lihuaxuella thermophila]|uniref:Uncharacterized protein n=1 Tax=Lihuaxuella thermophila TaxID=1173111 RepID=A0A1H8B4K6_9BACL|nr:hypothetical protein [Lihuaxuella thermophila]SEM77841.1 hypothetical protein SAMN05444955_1021 [Lihuaxuella thermophila]